MKKALPLTLVLIGGALLITAVVFWIDSSTSTEPQSFGKTLMDWVTFITGLGASIKGWMDLFKKEMPTRPTTKIDVKGGNPQISTGDHTRNIQAETYIENQTVQQPPEPKTPKSINQLPAPPSDFIGREKELTQLQYNIEKGVLISSIQGMGGIGKTALGLKLADQIAPRYPDGQIYIDLRGAHEQTPLTPKQVMIYVIRSFHPDASLPSDFGELGALYRSILNEKKVLLFYDNARDEDQLLSLLPPKRCILLVTSRQHFYMQGLSSINLETLNFQDARKLVQEIAPMVNDNDADALAERCGYLPLAIRTAVGSLLLRRDWHVINLIARLRDNKARLATVENALSLSYDALDRKSQNYLLQLSVFNTAFDKDDILAIWDIASNTEIDVVIGQLLKISILNFDKGAKKYFLHDLTKLFLTEKFLKDKKSKKFLKRIADSYWTCLKEFLGRITKYEEEIRSLDGMLGSIEFEDRSSRAMLETLDAFDQTLNALFSLLDNTAHILIRDNAADIIVLGDEFFNTHNTHNIYPSSWRAFWKSQTDFRYYYYNLRYYLGDCKVDLETIRNGMPNFHIGLDSDFRNKMRVHIYFIVEEIKQMNRRCLIYYPSHVERYLDFFLDF